MYAIPFQIFWTENYEFRFPNLKIWVQFSDTIINRNSFCIHATVNIRNSISDVLDLKLWVQIPEHKNLSSVFRTFFWGRYLKKIEEKNQKSFKVPKCPKTFPSVQTCFGAIFLKIFFPVFYGVVGSFRKNQKRVQKCKNAQDRSQNCPNLFWTCFVAIFSKKKLPRVPWRVGPSKFFKKIKIFQNSESAKNRSQKSPNVFWTCFGAMFSKKILPSVPCRAF